MSNLIAEPPVEGRDQGRPPPATRPAAAEDSRRRAGLVAGVGILAVAALAAFGNFAAVQGLITNGDAAATARDIAASEGIFRLGVVSLYLVVALDVLVAWALFRVFRPVHEGLSRLAAWLRLAYASVFLVALAQLAGVPDLLSTRTSSAFTPEQVDAMALAKVDTFTDIWTAGLLLFGLHLLALGYLTWRSGQMPRLLGVLLAIAGLGYAYDTVVAVLSDGSPFAVSTVTFVGEFLLAVWLVVRHGRLPEDSRGAPVQS
jgi:hypothetical protein